ncbi:hypothetical protein V8F20_007299 [Naviculisporaceae sp. PSN 640]
MHISLQPMQVFKWVPSPSGSPDPLASRDVLQENREGMRNVTYFIVDKVSWAPNYPRYQSETCWLQQVGAPRDLTETTPPSICFNGSTTNHKSRVVMSPLAVPESPSGLMPRRQSCDRCHEQKVRCFTNEKHCSKGQDDCADASLPQSGRYISPNPCSRCKRAKATCIYSPQQRSGRPRLPRDTTAAPVRKRRVSRRSSMSNSRSPTSSPSASPSIAPPSTNIPGVGIWNPTQFYQQPFETQVPSHYTDLSVHSTEYYQSNQHLLTQHNTTFGDWSSLPVQGVLYSTTESHVSLPPIPAEIPMPSPFILRSNASPATTPHKRRHQDVVPEPGSTWSYESPAANSYIEQLTEINLRIYRVSQDTALPHSTMAFSPTINEICNTASSLADLTERYNSERASIATTPLATSTFDYNAATITSSAAISSAMDASICLMIYSSHQSILGAFEDICNSFLIWLSEVQNQTASMNMMGMFARPSDTISQIVSMTNLLSHLLQRLENSVRSFDMDIDPSLSSLQMAQQNEYEQLDEASGTSFTTGTEYGYPDGRVYGYASTTEGEDTNSVATSSIFSQMEQKQNRVKGQIKAIRRWIRKSGEIS